MSARKIIDAAAAPPASHTVDSTPALGSASPLVPKTIDEIAVSAPNEAAHVAASSWLLVMMRVCFDVCRCERRAVLSSNKSRCDGGG
jgi:hypothetical protein